MDMQMLAQIATIREIASTNQLTETLSSFAVGQELAMASNLIGKRVNGWTPTPELLMAM